MPVQECREEGRPGWRWGSRGKCYTYSPGDDRGRREAREKAERQGRAVEGKRAAKADDEVERELSRRRKATLRETREQVADTERGQFEDGIRQLRAITDEEWAAAEMEEQGEGL